MTNDHKHCVFCGEVVTGHVTNICHSPQNPYPPDTVGNKHHCVLMSSRERAVAAVARFKDKPVKLSDEFDKDWKWYCPTCGEGYDKEGCDLCNARQSR